MAKKTKNFSTVYFSRDLSPENIFSMYNLLEKPLSGNIAIKLHSGERGNKNFLDSEYLDHFISSIGGTIIETNTAYEGARNTTENHLKLLEEHGWADYPCDILDENPEEELVLDIPVHNIIDKNYTGKNLERYNSCIVLSHFKGHRMGGYGGALKQLSIGFASSKGKKYIHGYGDFERGEENLNNVKSKNQRAFIKAMADAAKSIVDYFNGNIVFINILKNISSSCDCDPEAPEPCMQDIGIMVSLDPVAIDQACLDIVNNSDDEGKEELLERINSLSGAYIMNAANKIGVGNKAYKLVEVGDEIPEESSSTIEENMDGEDDMKLKIINEFNEYNLALQEENVLVFTDMYNSDIDAQKISELEFLYNCNIADDVAKRVISYTTNTPRFMENNIRLLSYNEIRDAEQDLHVNFIARKLLPLFDCSDNNFIVYNLTNNTWSYFNIVDQITYGESNTLEEVLNKESNINGDISSND